MTRTNPEVGGSPRRPTTRPRPHTVLVLVALVGLAFNLRPAAGSIGPVIAEVEDALGLSAVTAGVLTALPVLAFSVMGASTPWLASRVGVHRLSTLALVATAAGLGVRAATSSELVFLTASSIALGGMACANVLLPSLVKLHFPDRVGPVTAAYTTALALGMAMSTLLTVPIAQATGSWRGGLAVWAGTAALAVLPWLAMLRHDQRPSESHHVALRTVARTRLGRLMALAFGLQSLQAYSAFGWFAQVYRDAGYSPTTAGVMLGIVTGMGIPISLATPALAARRESQVPLMVALLCCYPLGLLGLILWIEQVPWLWAIVLGVSQGVFPLILTLLGLRTRTPGGTVALSGFAQSVGYLIAAAGPIGMSLLHEATGGWTLPLSLLVVLVVPLAWSGVQVARPGHLEDELEGTALSGRSAGGTGTA